MAISGLNKQEAITLLQRQGLSTAQQAQVLSSAGLLQTTQMLNASLVEEAVLNSKISGEKAEQILTELGVIEAKTGNLIVTKECTVAEVAQALATKGIVGADAEAILSQLGLATANTTTTASFAGLTTAIKANTVAMAKWLVTNPVGWCILAVGAIYGLSKAYDALTVSEEEIAEAHEESVEKAKQSISEYEELKQELEAIQQTYDDNKKKLEDLYKLRENQTITQAEEDYLEELEGQNEKLRQQIEYKQTLADIEAKEAEDDAIKTLKEKTQNDITTAHSNNGGLTTEYDKITDAEKIKQNTGTINALTNYLIGFEKVIQGVELSQDEVDRYQKQLDTFQKKLDSVEGSSYEADAQREVYQDEIDLLNNLLNGSLTYEQYEKAKFSKEKTINNLISENEELLQKVEPLNEAIVSTTGENYELKKANDEIIANAKDAAIAFNGYTDSLNGTADALGTVGEKGNEIDDLSFKDAFNAEEFSDTKEKLLELAKSGELSPYTLLSTKEYNSLLEKTGLTAEQAYSEIMKIAQSDMFMDDWNSTLENARSQIAKIDELLTELDGNGQTSSFVDDIISDYPQLLEYLGDEQALREQLKALQEEQEDVARKAYTQLVSDSETYYNTFKNQETERLNTLNDTINTTISKNKSLVDTLGENYKIDLNNYKSITDAKAKLELELIKNSASAWSKFYKVQVDATTGYASIIGSTTVSPSEYLDSSGDYGAAVNKFVEEQKKQKQSAQDVVDTYNSIIASLDSIANSTNITDTSSSSSSSKDKSSDIDWIETKLNNVDKALDKLNNTIDDTYSNWTDRSKALKDAITDTEKAIGLQEQAYTKYMQKAESIKLPEYLKERVRLGDMSIQNDVNSDTKELIDEYSEWYEKAQEAKEAQDELNKSLSELKASTAVDMIEEYYDAIDEAHSNLIESTQNKIDKAETMGFFANGSYYDNIGEELAKQKSNLEKKKADLDKVLANSGLDKNSSSYTELQNLIGSISNEIQQLTIDIEDNKNAAQENEWNYFDYLRESVTRLIDEADFFIELMSNEDLFDDKGNFTKYADATLALHNSNYEVYMANAREYAEKMKALEEDIANGIIGGTLAEDRYRELEDARRDAIQSAQDEKNAILDLVENGLQKELDYLNEIIDKKRESLKQEKSLFEYQKSIEEKTKTRDSLRRQLDVYKNDNSEEGLAQVQKLSVELQKAEDAIAETEMEKAMDDVESMLNDISSEYEEWINARLDNEDELLRQIQDKLGENGDINSTLKEISDKYGVSMSDSLKTAIVDGKPFDNVTIAINNLIAKITEYVNGNNVESNMNSDNTNVSNGTTTTQPSTTPNTTNDTDTSSEKNYDNIFIHKTYSKKDLDPEYSLVDRLKDNDIQADFQSRAMYWSKIFGGTYTGSASQNRQFMSWLKENGYKNGTFSATKGWHLFDELGLGSEVIITKDGAMRQFDAGDKVINAEGTSNLFTFANDPQGFLEKFGVLNYAMPAVNVKMPDPSMFTRRNATNGVNLGSVNIEVGQVVANDPMEFAKQMRLTLANDRNTQKMVQELGLGQSLGNNSMNVKRYL